ncbi:MAG TPA: nuclear transport factor 2 family protein [Candidatus Krumholzibacterium sp.]|nr:nuclear transport factor 2 family protein [Candidatus Krumholzibacterium sp.]
MRHKISIMLFCAALTGMILSCEGVTPEEKRDAEIEAITRSIDSCIGWFKDKDFDLLYSVVAHDSNYISVHPRDKVIKGFADFEKNSEVFRYPGFKYNRHEISDLRIGLSRAGDTAWFYCVLDDMNTWDGEPANWENARWTGVLEKRDGRWVIVQQHFSFPKE